MHLNVHKCMAGLDLNITKSFGWILSRKEREFIHTTSHGAYTGIMNFCEKV